MHLEPPVLVDPVPAACVSQPLTVSEGQVHVALLAMDVRTAASSNQMHLTWLVLLEVAELLTTVGVSGLESPAKVMSTLAVGDGSP